MSASEQISETVFKNTITRAVQDVFKTMFGLSASLSEPPPPDDPGSDSPHGECIALLEGKLIVGTVGFIGELSGLIYLYLEADFASQLARQILGMSDKELTDAGDEVVNDVVGELTNMTVGTFKNQLCDHGYPCKLTIPSILRGSNFSVEPISSASRRIYRFSIAGRTLVADLLVKQGD